MTIFSASDLSKAYGIQTILQNVSFKIDEFDKIGIVGVNGAGKTTLFRLLVGDEEVDSGTVIKDKGLTVAYMQQHSDFIQPQNEEEANNNNFLKSAFEEVREVFQPLINMEEELLIINKLLENSDDEALIKKQHTLSEAFADKGGLIYINRVISTLMGLGFLEKEIHLPLSSLSGGQQTRVLLAKILLSDAKLLLLDEPTNHLDINSTRWLEEFLVGYKGAILLISHDRYFLDRVIDHTFEIENNTLIAYGGNYSYYKEKKEFDRLSLEKDYTLKQKEIKRIESIIEQQKRFNQERNYVTIRSKLKQIGRITETLVKPTEEPDEIGFSFQACSGTGNDVLILKDIEKKYEQKQLFRNVNMLIKKGDKVFLSGPNGCGKTTLLRIITGQTEADSGSFKIGARVEIGYYDQTQSDLDLDKTVFDEVASSYPFMTNTEVRKALGAFLFHGDDVFKKISALSGGERARVSLVKLMLSKTNFLILDEPTNHLDIASKEALENTLDGYDGTLLIVSHDRYFINKLASKIFDMSVDGLTLYEGNYDFFLEKTANSNLALKTTKEVKPNIFLQKKAEEAEIRKKKNRIMNIENEISKSEDNIKSLNDSLSTPDIIDNYEKILEISALINEKQEELSLLYNEWEELSGEL